VKESVQNLRKIWEQKKNEMGFRQAEAARTIGWTQGALSQYLNEITELNPAAVIKFANFLGVDPREIDPHIIDHMPNVESVPVIYKWSDAKHRLTNQATRDVSEGPGDYIELDRELDYSGPSGEFKLPKGTLVLITTEPSGHRDLHSSRNGIALNAIVRKGSDEFELVERSLRPPKSQLKKNYAVFGFRIY